MNTQKGMVTIGDVRKEFLEIEKIRKSDGMNNIGLEGYTKYAGGVLTLICC